jgi:murein DD-endopeptidase MepM/ murein hydrolase activator NlpD
MRAFYRTLRILSSITLFFFCWTFLPLYAAVAYAAAPEGQKSGARSQKSENQGPGSGVQGPVTSGERFEKALEAIREKIGKAEKKLALSEVEGKQDFTSEVAEIKKQRAEIESADIEFKKEFAATEKKLKDAKLPKEILDRHAKFVKHYEDNLAELKTNLVGIEQGAGSKGFKEALTKTKTHLEKTKAPSHHQKLDPNNLPNRMVKAKKEKAPRLKKEEFEKDFPTKKKQKTNFTAEVAEKSLASWYGMHERTAKQKPIVLAYNGDLIDLGISLPRPSGERPALSLPNGAEVRGGFDSAPNFELGSPNSQAFPAHAPNSELATPIYQIAQAIIPPAPEDLSETPEVRFTPELRQIATLLENNPVQLYEFVRNNFTYDPYYGSVKGSQGTLFLQNGNDIDQASVLIALFRVSGIPARYAYGTVEIPIEKVMKWLGGITYPRTAGTVLATNGIPAKLIISGGEIKSVQLEHTWIEVYIPYANYRGLINDPTAAKTWIPLDPSFKFIEPNPDATDLAASQQFDIDSYLTTYLQTVKPTTPAKEYLKNSIDYVTANIPGKRFYDLLVSNTIADKVLGLLPDTLPYPVKSVGAKFSAIPDTYRHRIALEFTAPNTNETVLNFTASWTSVLHNRFTLSYTPATAADEQIIANYGNIYSTPSYLIQVKPVLKVEGITVAEGTAVPMASDLMCRMSFIWPDGTIDKAVTNSLVAGAPYAIGLGSGYTTGRIVTNRTAKLEAAVNAGQIGEPIIGEYLNLFAMNYLQELDSSRKLIAKSMKTLDTNRSAELMVGVDLGVSAVFGIPRAVDIRGVLIDVDYNIATPVSINGDQTKVRRFEILAGMTSSALEHTMFESIIGAEAVSTIKALEIANLQGIPVHQIDASNIATKLPLLQLSSEVKTDIQNAVNAGKVVIVSERNIQLNSWTGVGYIVKDPETGAGAYLISGGISGGSLTSKIAKYQEFIKSGQIKEEEVPELIRKYRGVISFRSPMDNVHVTSEWAKKRCLPECKPHNGVDIRANIGTTVFAVAAGQASSLDNPDGYGNYVLINHGLGVYTLYGHLSSAQGSGQVEEGEQIGLSGDTGKASKGPHLHFAIFVTDEKHPLAKNGVYNFEASVNPQEFDWTF